MTSRSTLAKVLKNDFNALQPVQIRGLNHGHPLWSVGAVLALKWWPNKNAIFRRDPDLGQHRKDLRQFVALGTAEDTNSGVRIIT